MKKKSIKSLKNKLKDLVREYIRLRDKDQCQWCLKRVYGSNSHPSHVKPKSTHGYLRYNPINIKLLCMHCHQKWHLDITAGSEWFKHKFPTRWEYLQKSERVLKTWHNGDLEEEICLYQKRLGAGAERN